MSVRSQADEERVAALVAGVRSRQTRAIARSLRLVDDRDRLARLLLSALYPITGGAYIVGVTGMPGSGKSTLVDRLIERYRARGKSVGAVAVDPTSPFSGGAILGDRIRMQRHFLDEHVFIRSLATRGHLGGLSRSASDVIHVLDAAGFDVVLVETVGVGQDELDVARLAHTTVVVMAPGMGDDIQAIKAGILEIADVFAVNKADRDGADATVRDLEGMVALGASAAHAAGRSHSAAHAHRPTDPADDGHGYLPAIVKTVAVRGEGVDELVEACDAHRAHLESSDDGTERRRQRDAHELAIILRDTLVARAEERLGSRIDEALDAVGARRIDPYTAVDDLVGALFQGALGGPGGAGSRDSGGAS